MTPTTQKPKQNRVIRNLYAPTRLRAVDNQVVPVREIFKREFFTIDKTKETTEIEFFLPKNEGQEGLIKLLPGSKYGSQNFFINGSGEIVRIELNLYDPNGLPFDFHTRDATGGVVKEYEKLDELRRVLNLVQVIHRMDTEGIPIEDKLDNYIHAPHIDKVSKRETSLYSRYSSSSKDSRLGRLLGIELHGSHIYKIALKGSALLTNVLLSGCQIHAEALVLEDQSAISKTV